jgi:preprotein translocase subunit SecD
MIRFTTILFLAWMYQSFTAAVATTPKEKPAVKVEFRLAEDEPAKGLKEAIIEGTEKRVYLHKKAELTNEDIAEARGNILEDRTLAIAILFTAEGKKKIEKLSKENLHKRLAIIIDGKVVVAPVLNGVISERALIRDIPTFEEVERIVNAIDKK